MEVSVEHDIEVRPLTGSIGAAVRGALLEIGALWTGLVGLLGLIVFRRRELARVQV